MAVRFYDEDWNEVDVTEVGYLDAYYEEDDEYDSTLSCGCCSCCGCDCDDWFGDGDCDPDCEECI
ncbi:hypothetical protein SEA_ANON_40 [Gordonia phage Anon]|nr:hypothetical protein SEA_ANON_40 [Gordonia phage Anon]